MSSQQRQVDIGVLVFPACVGSSAVVPLDVFNIANTLVQFRPAAEHLRFVARWVSAQGGPVTGRSGLVFPTVAVGEQACEVLMVPGIDHDRPRDLDLALEGLGAELAAVRAFAGRGRLIATNCSGTILLAHAGLLDGRAATTSWWFSKYFQKRYPGVALDTEALMVRDGDFLTAGGVTAHIDLALAIVGHYGGDALRQMTAKVLLVDSKRASQAPYAAAAMVQGDGGAVIERARRWLNQRMDQAWTMPALAAHCHTSPRTLLRRFQKATGLSPIQYTQQLRIERAKALLETTNLSVEAITARCGYENVSTFSKVFKRWAQVTPREYRGKFGLRS